MDKLLTVTVPAYNVERYLPDCLDSLLKTTESDKTEILVIDDGSVDSTGSIADDYQKRYPYIVRVIHKENGGHGSTINVGIQEAVGKYFRVLDSDDCVDSIAYDAYLKKLKKIDCDFVATPFTCVRYQMQNDNTAKERIVREQRRSIEGAEYLIEGKIYGFPEVADRLYVRMHECTFRTAILKEHGIRLTEHSFYVDVQYALYPVPWIQTICFLPENIYRYRLGMESQSISSQNMQKNRNQHRNVLHTLVAYYKEREAAGDEKSILAYLARGIAKMEADEVQTVLSMPIGKKAKQELLEQEEYLKQECPEGYRANQKKSIYFLRLSNYLIYPLAAIAWRIVKK